MSSSWMESRWWFETPYAAIQIRARDDMGRRIFDVGRKASQDHLKTRDPGAWRYACEEITRMVEGRWPTLHGVSIVGVEMDMMRSRVVLFAVHPSFPRMQPGGMPEEIDADLLPEGPNEYWDFRNHSDDFPFRLFDLGGKEVVAGVQEVNLRTGRAVVVEPDHRREVYVYPAPMRLVGKSGREYRPQTKNEQFQTRVAAPSDAKTPVMVFVDEAAGLELPPDVRPEQWASRTVHMKLRPMDQDLLLTKRIIEQSQAPKVYGYTNYPTRRTEGPIAPPPSGVDAFIDATMPEVRLTDSQRRVIDDLRRDDPQDADVPLVLPAPDETP